MDEGSGTTGLGAEAYFWDCLAAGPEESNFILVPQFPLLKSRDTVFISLGLRRR